MTRRRLMELIAIIGLISGGVLLTRFWFLRKIYYRLEGIFKASNKSERIGEGQKGIFKVLNEAHLISVEMALNSRCTSDYDGNQYKFHWGLFNEFKRISKDQINEVIKLINIPRFTQERVEIRAENNTLAFIMEVQKNDLIKDYMMIESGMLQQAVCLVCAALGIGIIFNSSNKDGKAISSNIHENIKIKIDAAKPSYDGSYWTKKEPKGSRTWLKDNLPQPIRNGRKPLLSILSDIKRENLNGQKVNLQWLSQLLWAARGRTPHFYKSKPWGMTIPTWGGEQNITSLYLIKDNELFRYVNWRWGGWAHSIKKIRGIELELKEKINNLFPSFDCQIILAKNETYSRAFWEIGYQLFNLIIQALAIELKFKAVLFDIEQREIFKECGISEPICGMFF